MSEQKKEQPAPQAAPKPVAGQALTTTATGQSLAVTAETAGMAMAAYSRALVEARFVMAMQRPRDMATVRRVLLDAIERPGFAGSLDPKDPSNKGAAWFRKPVGEGVEGFTIRFAEEAMRALGNIDVRVDVVFDDQWKRILVVTVLDLETNVGQPFSIVVEKTVERKWKKDGQAVLRTRLNSENKTVYVVEATDDEVFTKQNNLVSKIIRNEVLRIVPGDIQAECRDRILKIRLGAVVQDPMKVQKEVADAFARLHVSPSELKKYLGHELATCTPGELADLRDIYREIEKNETTWHDVMMERFGEHEEEQAPKPPATDAMKERLRQAAQPPKPPETPKEQPKEAATSPATEPGASEAAAVFTDAVPVEGQPAVDCKHPNIGTIPPGKSRVCNDCTLTVKGPDKPKQSKLIT